MSDELAEPVKSGIDLSAGTARMSDLHRWAAHKRREDQKQEAQKRKEREKSDDDHLFAATVLSDLASAERIEAFRTKLDGYDQATIEALEENERLLSEVRAAREAILAQAHVLEDGRRVFRTADGTAVIDEHGNPVGPDIIDPDAIPHNAPLWEEFGPTEARHKALEEQRAALLEFQQRLDEARVALDAGEITEQQLQELEAGLIADMPEAVRAQLPPDHPAAIGPGQSGAETTPQREAVVNPSLDGLTGFAPPSPGG